jgi:NAD+ synthase (glutamine-hydrolysing)
MPTMEQESYSPDDNRKCFSRFAATLFDSFSLTGFDLRPFLYPSRFPWQFKKIDQVAAALPDRSNQGVMDKTKTE